MRAPPTRPKQTKTRRLALTLVAAAAGLGLMALVGAAALAHTHDAALEQRLLAADPSDVLTHPDLVRFADAEAKPIFAHHCSGCHGANLKGRADIGAPDLTDQAWLYGDGGVIQIERTILYGIRSGQSKTRDITEMPAYGQRGQLSRAQISDVVQYVLELSRRPHDEQAALSGKIVFNGQGGCYDCHGPDAKGDTDYGAPDLTDDVWAYGGSASALNQTLYYGRHGVMPAWIGTLTLPQIRALAIYVHDSAQR